MRGCAWGHYGLVHLRFNPANRLSLPPPFGQSPSHGPIAQRLEHGTHNSLVLGSNPGGPTNFPPLTVNAVSSPLRSSAGKPKPEGLSPKGKALAHFFLKTKISMHRPSREIAPQMYAASSASFPAPLILYKNTEYKPQIRNISNPQPPKKLLDSLLLFGFTSGSAGNLSPSEVSSLDKSSPPPPIPSCQ